MKVLIADDDPMYRALLQNQVKQWGFTPQCADDGVPAWKILCEDESPPRLVILDWQMNEMDGIELCQRIKRDDGRPFTFVILLTSRTSQEDMLEGLDCGADDFLSKPVDAMLLRSRLNVAKRIVEAVPPKGPAKPSIPNYTLGEQLGKGAFATVWRAKSQLTGNDVAIKVLPVDLCTDRLRKRFSREVSLLRELDHPNVAKIHDSLIDDELAFYAMDLFELGTLDEYARKHEPGGVAIIKIMSKVLDGLQHLHSQGVIHRDLKTSNIMMADDHEPKIVDFGLGKSMFQTVMLDPELTLDHAIMGTPLFMSPEQARGDQRLIDHRTDVYSAAVVLYVLLLKRHPRNIDSKELEQSDDIERIMSLLSGSDVIEPRKIHPRFNEALQRILLKGLARDPARRYQSAKEFSDDMKGWLRERAKSAAKA